jgi:protein dithiol oxidoreductase (disulfide-forming)
MRARGALRGIGAALLLGLLSTAPPASAAEPREGRDYTVVVPAMPRPDLAKVVVLDFFSYVCPHCAAFAPALREWEEKLPADVTVDRVAVGLGRQLWLLPAQLYYALRSVNKAQELDAAVFAAIHADHVDFSTTRQVVDWVAGQGIDRASFEAAIGAFSVKSFVARGDQLAGTAQVSGVPTLVIDGRYRVEIDTTGDLVGQLAVVDALIAKARTERGLAPPR